jgi:integrase
MCPPQHPRRPFRDRYEAGCSKGISRWTGHGRLHEVRHSYATAALRAGVPVKVVSERLGHASVAFTFTQDT